MFESPQFARTLSREELLMTATATVTHRTRRIDAVRVNSGATHTSSAQQAQPRLRLTKRGRVVFGGLATVLVAAAIGVAAAFAAPGAIANSEVSSQEFPYVFVQSGDSLWSIATELEPSGDPRDVVSEIVRLNQLQGADLQAGDAVAVPLRFTGNELTVPASEL